jgi:transposase
MLYSGIDLHKNYSVISTMNQAGKVVSRAKVKNRQELLLEYFHRLDDSSHKAVIEACFAWGWLADLLEANKIQVMLSHPQRTKAIAAARIKTDKVDADTLAHLLRTNLVAPAHYSDRDRRDQQELLRTRSRLVHTRTTLKNKLGSILHKHNLNPEWDGEEFADLFGKKGRIWMEGKLKELPPYSRFSFRELLAAIDQLKERVNNFDQEIKNAWETDDNAKLLQQLPGIGFHSGLLLSAEIGNVGRFRSPEQLCSYAGLTPSVYQSGNKTRMGRIKPGNKYIRWVLVEAVPKAIKKDRRLNAFYCRIAGRKGNKKAKVAAARKMLAQIWLILKNQQPFRQEPGIPVFLSDQRPVNG